MSGWLGVITNEWRLKLLALALAVVLLGAVAFSQYQPTQKTVSVQLSYTVRDGFILINPPTKTNVTVQALSDVLSRVDASNTFATVDATHVEAGAAVKVDVRAATTVQGAKPQQPAPILVNVDLRVVKEVAVQVGVRVAPGWSVTKAVATCPGSSTPDPCKVHFDGPASWQTNLTATAALPPTVQATTIDFPNQPIQLGNAAGAVGLGSIHTVPDASVDVTTANLHVEAVAGVTSSTVPLVDAPPSHGPPAGYRITGVTIAPLTVVITGAPAAVGRTRSILLPALDLSSSTGDVTIKVNITYPNGITGTAETATITYTIAKNPNAA